MILWFLVFQVIQMSKSRSGTSDYISFSSVFKSLEIDSLLLAYLYVLTQESLHSILRLLTNIFMCTYFTFIALPHSTIFITQFNI
jgi:hypothetical protein